MIFSSHILSEVQAICDQIIMIAHGQLVAFGKPEELQKQLLNPGEVVLTTDASEAEVRKILADVDHITALTVNATASSTLQANTNDTGKTDSAQTEDIPADQTTAPVSVQAASPANFYTLCAQCTHLFIFFFLPAPLSHKSVHFPDSGVPLPR